MTRRYGHQLRVVVGLALVIGFSWSLPPASQAAESFEGQFYRGTGDVDYLQLLDISRRMLDPDPEFQNLPMLYTPAWNGFVEGPTWGAWWIQNSYGTTYCALPSAAGAAHHVPAERAGLVVQPDGRWQACRRATIGSAPDGCLCDAASPGWIYLQAG